MPLINLSNPFNILVALVIFVLTVYLAIQIKRSNITCIMLLVFLTILVGHCIEFIVTKDVTGEITSTLSRCIVVDFVFIFLSFISYLWTDDIEAKARKLKTIDNSLDWFWKKV